VTYRLTFHRANKKARYQLSSRLFNTRMGFSGGSSRIRTADLWIMIPLVLYLSLLD
jgi:hypothetical protein